MDSSSISFRHEYLWLITVTIITTALAAGAQDAHAGESGYIVYASPSSFTGGVASTVTVRVRNTGDSDHMIIEWDSKPSGWSISPGYHNPYMSSGSYYNATFTVTPPTSGGSGTIVWKFYDDDVWSNDLLDTLYQSVSATVPKEETRISWVRVSPNPLIQYTSGSLGAKLTKDDFWHTDIPGKTIKFYVNGSYVGSDSGDSDGESWESYTPTSSGTITVRAVFEGDSDYYSSEKTESFTVTAETTPPSTPSLQTPSNGSSTSDQTPYFNWTNSSDSGSGMSHYEIEIYDKDLSWGDISATPTSSNYTPSSNIPYDRIYWKVRAVDNEGNKSSWTSEWWFDLVQPNHAPDASRYDPTSSSITLDYGETKTFKARGQDQDGNLDYADWTLSGPVSDSDHDYMGHESDIISSYSHTFNTSGNYTLTCVFTDEEGATDSVSWSVTVSEPKGNLNVTVKNQNSSNIAGAQVVRYTSDWTHIDEKTTNSSGVASWSNISTGDYKLEAYYNGEYWVNDSATVTAGSTTNKAMQRNEPYAYDFKVYDGSTDVTGATVISGTSLRCEVKVRNSGPVSRTVRVKLWVDRDQSSSYDFYETSSSQSVSSSGGTKTFTFYHTPSSTGTYYRKLEVETYVNNNWSKTDSWPWGNAFTATAPNQNPQLSNGYVTPTSGDTTTDFYYYVDYYDPDGDTPDVGQVTVYGDPMTWTWSMSLYSGSLSNGTYRAGPINLKQGSYTYDFYFTDGNGGEDTLPSSGEYSGPSVDYETLNDLEDVYVGSYDILESRELQTLREQERERLTFTGRAQQGIAAYGNDFYTSAGILVFEEMLFRYAPFWGEGNLQISYQVTYDTLSHDFHHLGDIDVYSGYVYGPLTGEDIIDIAWFNVNSLEHESYVDISWLSESSDGESLEDISGLAFKNDQIHLLGYEEDLSDTPKIFVTDMLGNTPRDDSFVVYDISTWYANGLAFKSDYVFISWGAGEIPPNPPTTAYIDIYELPLSDFAVPIKTYQYEGQYTHAEGITFYGDELWVAQDDHIYQLENPLPQAPTGLSASKGEYTDKVRLIWNSVNGANGYKIYRNSTNDPTSATLLANNDGGMNNIFEDYDVVSGVNYYYWVRADKDILDNDNNIRELVSEFSGHDYGYVGNPPELSVNPNNRDVGSSSGSTNFSVSNTAGGTMEWTAEVIDGDNWLSITSGSSGTDSGTIQASFTENTSASSRIGTIRVTASGATGSPADVTVTQAGTGGVEQYTLTTNVQGQGNINLNPAGGVYDSGTEVELTANPDAGWHFDHWQGNLGGSTNPETILMDNDKDITAVFEEDLVQCTITASSGSNGSIEPNGVFDVTFGNDVLFTATPDLGYNVAQWIIDGNVVQEDNTIYTLHNIQANHNVYVTFEQDIVLTTLYVDNDADGANNGTSWPDAYNYLQDALAYAETNNEVNEIRVAQGIYKPDQNSVNPNGTGKRKDTFQLVNGVTLKGGYSGFSGQDPNARNTELYETILSGDLDGNDVPIFDPCDLLNEPTRGENSYHVVSSYNADPNAVLNGFIITAGNANADNKSYYHGGGIFNFGSYDEDWGCMYAGPTIINCKVISNYSKGEGGGMFNGALCEPHIINCDFIENMSLWGGGGIKNDTSDPIITNCMFRYNYADDGGAMDNEESSPKVINCMFAGNSSAHNGGAIENWMGGCSPMLVNCLFYNNSAEYGGVMCTSNNFNIEEGSNPELISCSLSQNTAVYGNALACVEGSFDVIPSNVQLNNCILWNGGNEIWNEDGSTITLNYSNIQDGEAAVHDPCDNLCWGDGNIDADPCFVDVDSNDFHLRFDSPCLDAGDPNYVSDPNYPTDLDGNPRFIDGDIDGISVVDMGAYEYDPFVALFDVNEKSRIGRTMFRYKCWVILSNLAPGAVENVQLELIEVPDNIDINDPYVSFAYIDSWDSASSEDNYDYCILDVDRAEPIDDAEIIWQITYGVVDTGERRQQRSTSTMEFDELEGDITGNGIVDIDDLILLVEQWLQPPGNPSADIAPMPDGDDFVDFKDLAKLAENWLQ